MKIFTVLTASLIIALIALGFSIEEYRINKLEKELFQTKESLASEKEMNVINISLLIEKINKLQDTLEERIGTLEHDVEDMKFLRGVK